MINFLTMMPHGDEVLNPPDGDTEELKKLMVKIGAEAKGIDVFLVLTPHSIRIMDQNSIIFAEHVSNGKDLVTDRDLANSIHENARKRNIPSVLVNFGALEGEASRIPLDWGTSIPLEFFSNPRKAVIISPAREIAREKLIEFGETISDVCTGTNKSIGIIVSADHAHTHAKDGPYGFSKYAKIYDDMIINAFKDNRIETLLDIKDEIVENAKPDSFWQILILIGILHNVKFLPVEVHYARPTYFGMMAVRFEKL